MFSVYRKELKLYFKTLSTYIVLAILLSAVGICTALFATIDGLQFVPVYLAPLTLLLAPMVQIFANRRQNIKVEVQLRTIAMDFWASLEHGMKYKREVAGSEVIVAQLKECADKIGEIDRKMQEINYSIEEI